MCFFDVLCNTCTCIKYIHTDINTHTIAALSESSMMTQVSWFLLYIYTQDKRHPVGDAHSIGQMGTIDQSLCVRFSV